MSHYKSGVLFTVVGALLWGISGTSGQFLLQQRGFGSVLLPIHVFCYNQSFKRRNSYSPAIFGSGSDYDLPFRQEQKITAAS